jgi:hypothetical protein
MRHHGGLVRQGASAIGTRAVAGFVGAGALILGLAASAVAARAETIITSHGISTFGDLKYPADLRIWTTSTRMRQRAARCPPGPSAPLIR